MLDLNSVQSLLLTLSPGESSTDQFGEVLTKVKFFKEQIADFDKQLKQSMIEHIKATGQDIVLGNIRYTVGTPAKHSSKDNAATLDALIEFEGGDISAVAEQYLVSEPFKHGSVRKAIGDDKFDELFETTRAPKLVEGKEQKQLLEINTNFVR